MPLKIDLLGVTVVAGGETSCVGFDWYYGLALARAAVEQRDLPHAVVYDSRNGGTVAVVSEERQVEVTLENTNKHRTYADFMSLVREALEGL